MHCPDPQRRDAQVGVVELGVDVAQAEREQQALGRLELGVDVEAHTRALVGIHELDQVARAADSGELLVLDLVVEHRTVDAHAVVREQRFEAHLDRLDGFGIGH